MKRWFIKNSCIGLVGGQMILGSLLGQDKGKLSIVFFRKVWNDYPPASLPLDRNKEIKYPSFGRLRNMQKQMLESLKIEKFRDLKKEADHIRLEADNEESGYIQVGVLYAQAQEYNRAIAHLEKALKINNKNVEALNNIASAYRLDGNSDKALDYYFRAYKLAPRNPKILLNMAFVYYEEGELDKARGYYRKAIYLDPSLDQEQYKVILRSKKKN